MLQPYFDVARRATHEETLTMNGPVSNNEYFPLIKFDSLRAELLLFGQLRAGLEQEAVECCVLVGEVRWRRGALEVQAANNDIEHRRDGCQLHAIKHGWQLCGDGVRVRVVAVHD